MTPTKLPNWMAGDWLTNRRILVAVIFAAGFGVAGPGLFGLGPPKWFEADDDKLLGLPAPATVTLTPALTLPPHTSPPETSNMGVPKSSDSEPTNTQLSKNLLASRIPAEHQALSGAAQKQSFIDLVLPLIAAANS